MEKQIHIEKETVVIEEFIQITTGFIVLDSM